MRRNYIFMNLIGTLIAIIFVIAAYFGYNLSLVQNKQAVLYTFLEAELIPTETLSEGVSSASKVGPASFQFALLDNGFRIEEVGKFGEANAQYHIYADTQLVGQLILDTTFLLETGDYYYFMQYKPLQSLSKPLNLRASLQSNSKHVSEAHISYPEHEEKVRTGDIATGTPPRLEDGVLTEATLLHKEDKLPTSSLYLGGEDFSLHLNRINVYEPLGNGVRRAYDELSANIEYYSLDNGNSLDNEIQHHFEISLPHLEGMEVEHWGIVGASGMFAWDDKEQRDLFLIANLDRVRKWTRGGFQYLTPTTYYPYDPNGFWLVPAQHVGNRLLLSGKDRFSKNIALLSLDAALETQTEEGMWITQPRSEWLYTDYGIEAGFYDTRFSTDAGLFLIYGYRKFGVPMYLEGARKYADFLIEFARTHHHETENGGYLVWDYRDGNWDGKTMKETHVSLNHLITEMNFLYELYKELKESGTNERIDEYLKIAEKTRLAVQDTRKNWKKEENGDLWYAFLPNGSYGLLDYPLLTLKDLRYSQELIEEIYGERDADFQYLIEVKEDYLSKQGLPLYD